MRSMSYLSNMTSESNLYRSTTKSPGKKRFVASKSSSKSGPATSYKLSSPVRTILSRELQMPCFKGSDGPLQPVNSRRRFQRRGSKSASMLRSLSSSHMVAELLKNDSRREERTDTTELLIGSMKRISTESNRSSSSSYSESSSSMGGSMATLSSHMEDSSNSLLPSREQSSA
ncbi:unnamed protein product [Pseudo-nitzschia multistriata]|uniref:Uncharacterized protein n=1 Tax=Pseudo-nitzschia multistriata TaxID=183589 RepID=A0A448ZC75_9STRA|nr:unnamed protein product [Pseudo-nitzschia multistriata]